MTDRFLRKNGTMAMPRSTVSMDDLLRTMDLQHALSILPLIDAIDAARKPTRMRLIAYVASNGELVTIEHMGDQTFHQIYLGAPDNTWSVLVEIRDPPDMVKQGPFLWVNMVKAEAVRRPGQPMYPTDWVDREAVIGEYRAYHTEDAAVMAARTIKEPF